MKLYFFIKVQHTGDTDLGQADIAAKPRISISELFPISFAYCRFALNLVGIQSELAIIYTVPSCLCGNLITQNIFRHCRVMNPGRTNSQNQSETSTQIRGDELRVVA